MTFYSFKIGNSLLRDVILRQAGSVEKAIQEAIQNAKDSGATEIIVSIDRDKFVVEDNGEGMLDDLIFTAFQTFGDSVKAGDKTKIGEFGMGRGQIFAQGKTIYETLTSTMIIDVLSVTPTGELGFEHIKNQSFRKGTKVTCNFYEEKKLTSFDVDYCVKRLIKSFKFHDCGLLINGSKVDKICKSSIKYENNDFIAVENWGVGNCNIYNKGIFILTADWTILPYDILCNNLTVNFARNDIMKDENYKKLQSFISCINTCDVKSWDKRKNIGKQKILLQLLKEKKITRDDLLSIKFVPSYEGGSHYSLRTLENNKGKIFNTFNISFDTRYQKANLAKNECGGLYIECDADTKELLNELGIDVRDLEKEKCIMNKIDELLNKQERLLGIDDIEKFSVTLKNFIEFIKLCNTEISKSLFLSARKLNFVQNASYKAQTDGRTYISYNISSINRTNPVAVERTKIIFRMIHEYAHDTDDSNGYHDVNFFERYHNFTEELAEVITKLVRR